jgi:DNA-binding transcriptional regulator LsrR (DeoR family)
VSTESVDDEASVAQGDLLHLKLQLSVLLHVDGKQHVRSAEVARRTEWSSSDVERLLSFAVDEGWVEEWTQRGSRTTWRITLDEQGGESA